MLLSKFPQDTIDDTKIAVEEGNTNGIGTDDEDVPDGVVEFEGAPYDIGETRSTERSMGYAGIAGELESVGHMERLARRLDDDSDYERLAAFR